MTRTVLELTDVVKRYGGRRREIDALAGVTLQFQRGSFTAVMGPSGSGKSTLLQCASGLDRPTSGSVRLEGHEIGGMDERHLSVLRRERIGFVFQDYNLLPALTVAQNVALPARLAGHRLARTAVTQALAQVGLEHRSTARPGELSGGQRQRVAIARALLGKPAVLFGDEPTGALDTRTAGDVLRLLRAAVDERQQTVVMVTHDPVAASYADRVVFLADGRLDGELGRSSAEQIAERMVHLGAWGAVAGASVGGTS
ncbi:ABC transporter ATP-binding protein [Kineococcus sp. SYSU DK003]|uniref:ABC transporter ATP-binding protein n=1 Tax=Kineococcus sp. SYSU DK003 TaxID=3383124 RepID=UPI003D7E97E4